MAFSNQKNFNATLDGVTVYDLIKKIDYSKTKLEDRKKVIEDILNSTNFYQEYFDNYYNPSLSPHDSLAHENNVCRSLEIMATYLLNSDEVKEEKKKSKYTFFTDDDYLDEKINKEETIGLIQDREDIDEKKSSIYFFRQDKPNYKKDKKQKITAADLKRDDWLGEILRDYNAFLVYITNKLKENDPNINRYLLTRTKGQIEKDMIYCKDALLGVFGYKLRNSSESTKYDVDVFNFTNPNHLKGFIIKDKDGKKRYVKGLLYIKPEFDPNDDFSYVLLDLEETIKKANLTKREWYILNELRNGATKTEIAERLNVTHVQVIKDLEIIVRKICKVGNIYDGKRNEFENEEEE